MESRVGMSVTTVRAVKHGVETTQEAHYISTLKQARAVLVIWGARLTQAATATP